MSSSSTPTPTNTISCKLTSEELDVIYKSLIFAWACMNKESEGFAKDTAIVMQKVEELLGIETGFFSKKRWGSMRL